MAWPEHGYITELDVYLDPSTLEAGDGFDLTVAASDDAGGHLRDFIFHVGVHADGRLLVNGSNNSDAEVNDFKLVNDGDGTPTQITDAGWYTFQHAFQDVGGSLAVDLNVLDADGNQVFTTTRHNTADLIEDTGGARYQWFTFASADFEIDNQRLLHVVPTPAAPTSKDDCKSGGFEAYGFDNQGQCVASVQANDNAGK